MAKLDNRSGLIDLFWPGVLIVEQKSASQDLGAAYAQAGDYCDPLPERSRYMLVSDFRTFHLYDLDEQDTVAMKGRPWSPATPSWATPSGDGPGRVCPATSPERQPAAGGAGAIPRLAGPPHH